ncbi:hypothetical protein FEM33_01705 [Dyadobacter flavalbus]|uniref:Uncharacterized protein n=1 Tax=Dyadobacter flavalbus TaxID=2579942 RepID=A0A5M8R3G5_9BACT|nr:hypothetical protein [Dyadobacter flavalbus]KAA6441476.1 hypothetical protein FEM33_01705 [Dyadobacter flavalbus]
MLQKATKVAADYNEFKPSAEVIAEFFNYCGTAKKIEATLWDMLQGSLTNPELPTEAEQNAEQLFLFRRLKELLEAIEPVKFNSSDLEKN